MLDTTLERGSFISRRPGPRLRVAFGQAERRQQAVRRALDDRYIEAVYLRRPETWVDLDSVDLIVPFGERDYVPMWEAVSSGRWSGQNALLPTHAQHDLLRDKFAWTQWMRAWGMAHLVPIWDGCFPCVAKPARAAFGKDVIVARSDAELQAHRIKLDQTVVVQRLIPGAVEYATHIVADAGRVIGERTVRYGMAGPMRIKGRLETQRTTDWIRCPCLTTFRTVIAKLGYTGTCCIDYKLVDRVPMIFEINPRMGASLPQRLGDYLDIYAQAVRSSGRTKATAQSAMG